MRDRIGRRRDALPGRDARGHRIRDGQAASDGRGQRDDRLGRQAAGPDHHRPRRQDRPPTRWSSTTCRPTRPSSATPAIRCASTASGRGPRTPTGSTCRTRSPTALAGLASRIGALERAVAEPQRRRGAALSRGAPAPARQQGGRTRPAADAKTFTFCRKRPISGAWSAPRTRLRRASSSPASCCRSPSRSSASPSAASG